MLCKRSCNINRLREPWFGVITGGTGTTIKINAKQSDKKVLQLQTVAPFINNTRLTSVTLVTVNNSNMLNTAHNDFFERKSSEHGNTENCNCEHHK